MSDVLMGVAEQECSARLIDDDELDAMLDKKPVHNHMTRDIKAKGICPSCDRHHDRHHLEGQ